MITIKSILAGFLLVFCVSIAAFSDIPESDIPGLEQSEKYVSDIPVKVVKKISLPKGYHEGLFYNDSEIWVSNGKGGNTWIMDVSTGDMKGEIESIGSFTEGIARADNGTFWVTEWEDKKLLRVKIKDNKMALEYDISLDPAHPAGLVWTGKNLYVITWTRGLSGTKYHLMQLGDGERMFRKMQIKGINEPAHMAWDGKNLWITSWYGGRVYKVDINNFKVMGSFRSPAKDTTGIAWDGERFWITGTYDDLYVVEIGTDVLAQ